MTEAALAGRPDPPEYVRSVAALPGGRSYRSLAQTILDLAPGLTVLEAGVVRAPAKRTVTDVGCDNPRELASPTHPGERALSVLWQENYWVSTGRAPCSPASRAPAIRALWPK